MKENNVETGRSMLETLAVLAIIMVITIASIAGFDYLVQYRNRMETVKTVNLLISSIKSGNLGRHRAQSDPNSIWDAGEIVKGPKIEESALVLPDSDHSYAVVRTLNNGGWVMAMQINPKTCDEMFKSLTAQGAIVYRMFNKSGELSASQSALRLGSNKDNGDNDTFIGVASGSVARLAGTGESDRGCATVSGEDDCRLGVNLKYVAEECADSVEGQCGDAKKRLEQIIQACKGSTDGEDSEEKVAGYVLAEIECPGPVDAQGNFAGYDSCTGRCLGDTITMPAGSPVKCCPKNDYCGGKCNCKRPIGELGTDNCYCAKCDPNETDKDAAYCTDEYHKYKQHVCLGSAGNEACGECEEDNDCDMSNYRPDKSSGSAYTDSAFYNRFKYDDGYHMYCLSNTCRECNHDFDGGEQPSGEALRDIEKDLAYCPEVRPFCVDGVCKQDGCRDDHTTATTDTGCTTGSNHLCMPSKESLRNQNSGTGVVGEACRLCFDSNADDKQDDGCSSSNHLCAPNSGDGKYGSACYKCQRKALSGGNDLGCPTDGENHICPAASEGGYSNASCVKCIDNQAKDGMDRGCEAGDNNLCQPDSLEGYDISNPRNAVGSACKLCFNDKHPDTGAAEGAIDVGCDAARPKCDAAYGQFGDNCSATEEGVICSDDQTGSKQDTGCPVEEPETDETSDSAEEPVLEQMLCVPKTDKTKNNGSGASGEVCAGCFDNNPDEKIDDGCFEGHPLCEPDTDMGKYGNACHVCQDTQKNGETDLGCGKDEDTPLCNVATHTIGTKTNEYGTKCMACYNDKSDNKTGESAQDIGCSDVSKPYCKAALHDYGLECVGDPPLPPNCDEYYYKDGTDYIAMTDALCKKWFGKACSPKLCPVMRLVEDVHGCLCEQPVQDECDAYFAYVNKEYIKLDTPAQCKPFGDCKYPGGNFAMTSITYNQTSYAHACVATKPPVCSKNDCYHPETGLCVEYYKNDKYKWDDLDVKKENGVWICPCYDVVSTDYITDHAYDCYVQNVCGQYAETEYHGGNSLTGWSKRTIDYKADVKFYCKRYFYVEGGADDFISASYPSGIDKNAKKLFPTPSNLTPKGGCYFVPKEDSYCYGIYPNHSNTPIATGEKTTVWIRVRDYWLGQLGFTGYFYFPTKEYKEKKMKENTRTSSPPSKSFSGCYKVPGENINANKAHGKKVNRMKIYNKSDGTFKAGKGDVDNDKYPNCGSNGKMISFATSEGRDTSNQPRINALYTSCDVARMALPYSKRNCYK